MKKLIINADDFGYGFLFNKMILELLAEGSISSTSVMINCLTDEQKSQLEELKNYAKNDSVSIGLHLDFKTNDCEKETENQYNKFVDIMGFKPHHLDKHRRDHIQESYPIIQKFAQSKNIPCKNLSRYGEDIMLDNTVTTETSCSGTKKTFEEITDWLESLGDGIHWPVPRILDKYSHGILIRKGENQYAKRFFIINQRTKAGNYQPN